jgi:glycosyltransferase involved in cell wall biosynthesis
VTAATVVLPTTGDRGPLLRWSVASVLAQTVADLELFVVGDGVDDGSRAVARELAEGDPRVTFLDLPKHPRRGEPHRHELLRDRARGRIVAYLCDRDLWLPDHLAALDRLLADADLAHTLRVGVGDDDRFTFTHVADLGDPADRAGHRAFANLVPLSFAGHTLEAYRRLPHGWRATPEGTATDRYMWAQFLDQPWVRARSGARPTVLYFKRGGHPGLGAAERLALLERWGPRISSPDGAEAVRDEVLAALWRAWRELEVRERRRRARPWRRLPGAARRRLAGR